MKKILIILLTICSIGSFAQSVSVELSIEWKKTKSNNWKKHKFKKTPFLNITYVNNSSNPLYLTKVPSFFEIGVYYLPGIKNLKIDSLYFKNLKLHDNEKYFVEISMKNGNRYWNVLDEKEKQNIDKEKEVENNNINEDLHNVYYYLYRNYNNHKNLYNQSAGINISIDKENIVSKLKEFFIFLKPKQKKVDSYDLTGFNILGGNYNFILTDIELKDYVETIFLENENIYKKEKLPVEVNGFNLYSGKIKTNEVSVSFTPATEVLNK